MIPYDLLMILWLLLSSGGHTTPHSVIVLEVQLHSN